MQEYRNTRIHSKRKGGHSDYDTEIVPEYEDQILMLSTCSYHTKNGRFVVAARRVAEP